MSNSLSTSLVVSRVAITYKALLAEANQQSSSVPSFSGPSTPKLWGARWVLGAFKEDCEGSISFGGQN